MTSQAALAKSMARQTETELKQRSRELGLTKSEAEAKQTALGRKDAELDEAKRALERTGAELRALSSGR